MSFLITLLKRTAFTLLIMGIVYPLFAQRHPPRHYQVKAVFLYNFTQFVEWPPAAFPDSDAPLVVGILGEDPFGPYLEKVIEGEQINGHPLAIRRFEPGEEIKDCHVLFVNLPHSSQIAETLKKLQGQNILTVSDQADFLEVGGMIKFVSVNNKIQFQINADVASSADLKISSKLLRVAEIVTLRNE